MKTTISATVDVETYIQAKSKLPGKVSEYINQCLTTLASSEVIIDGEDAVQKLQNINNSLNDLKIKKDILEMEIQRQKEVQSEREKELQEHKRWVCPVCKTKNIMDSPRCSSCQLPTRNDKATEIVFDEVKA